MGKVLCYIYEEMADFEITLLMNCLHKFGRKEVITVSEMIQPVTGQSGLMYFPALKISDISPALLAESEALIIPGGPINNEQNEICPVVKQLAEQGKLIAAICFAPQFLGRAGILENYRFTTSCSPEKIKQFGCQDPFHWERFEPVRVCRDRNVITALGSAFVDFAEAVCSSLKAFSDVEQQRKYFEQIKKSDWTVR